jgi:hypothetical protein
LAWLAVSAFAIAANSLAYDAARWREGEAAVAMGYNARTVDAGYEWVGYHSIGAGAGAGAGADGDGARGQAWFEGLMWPSPACAILSNSPSEAGEPLLDKSLEPLSGIEARLLRVNGSAYRQFLFFGPAQALYLYGVAGDGCPPPPTAVVSKAS